MPTSLQYLRGEVELKEHPETDGRCFFNKIKNEKVSDM